MAISIELLRTPKLPAGFQAAGTACGIKAGGKTDLALLVSDLPTVSAATFTTNKVKASPVRLSMRHLKGGDLRAVLVNSGNANACNGAPGDADAKAMAGHAAAATGLRERQVFVCSTGIIGVRLPIDKIAAVAPALAHELRPAGLRDFAKAILTSDNVAKVVSARVTIGGKSVTVTGCAKGSGMISPNMATMLGFVFTDAAIERAELAAATRDAVATSFNCISVDGDMSTNDTVLVMANGAAGNRPVAAGSAAARAFRAALSRVMLELAKKLVRDGEGVTKFVTIQVRGAASDRDARKVAQAVANSALVKCSWNGSDPNWGRVIHAVGYAGAKVDQAKIDILFDELYGARRGVVADTPITKLKAVVARAEFIVTIDLHLGRGAHTVYTCDISEGYVAYNRLEYALKIQGR